MKRIINIQYACWCLIHPRNHLDTGLSCNFVTKTKSWSGSFTFFDKNEFFIKNPVFDLDLKKNINLSTNLKVWVWDTRSSQQSRALDFFSRYFFLQSWPLVPMSRPPPPWNYYHQIFRSGTKRSLKNSSTHASIDLFLIIKWETTSEATLSLQRKWQTRPPPCGIIFPWIFPHDWWWRKKN